MSKELTINGTLQYSDSEGSDFSISIEDFIASVNTKKFVHAKVSVGTSEEAIPLGEVVTPGQSFFKNLDPTNYVEIRPASGSSNDYIYLPPGGSAGPFCWGSDVTAPYWIANTNPCQCEYVIVSR